MPGMRCSIYWCNNSYSNMKGGDIPLLFHRFPKPVDMVSQMIRSEWINRSGRADRFNPDNSRICSIHFKETDYERDLQNELLGLPLKRKLTKTAVPSLYLAEEKPDASIPDEDRCLEDRQKNEVMTEMKQSVKNESTSTNSPDVESQDEQISSTSAIQDHRNYQEDYEEILEKYNDLKDAYQKNVHESKVRQKYMTNMITYYKKKIRYYKKKRYEK